MTFILFASMSSLNDIRRKEALRNTQGGEEGKGMTEEVKRRGLPPWEKPRPFVVTARSSSGLEKREELLDVGLRLDAVERMKDPAFG